MARKNATKLSVVTTQTPQEKKAILDALPATVQRVRVRDDVGKMKWRSPDGVFDTDIVEIDQHGKPFTMKGQVGRKKVIRLPSSSMTADQISVNKRNHIRKDKLVKLAKKAPESSKVLNEILSGLAEEAASLGFERSEAERRGENSVNISTKRVSALKAIGDTWAKRKELTKATGDIDLDSPAFEEFFKFLFKTFRDAMAEAKVAPDMSQAVFAKLSKLMDEGWKYRAVQAYGKGNKK